MSRALFKVTRHGCGGKGGFTAVDIDAGHSGRTAPPRPKLRLRGSLGRGVTETQTMGLVSLTGGG
eukprot:225133-Rhodomonas_salina.3